MSRKREGLADLLHWSRRPSTCEQVRARKDAERREDRPHTAIHGPANGGSSGAGQSSQAANENRSGLPPLSRNGSAVCGPRSNGAGALEVAPDSMSPFQEALYVNGHPHNATSRLLRLGAGSPGPSNFARRSATTSPSPGTMPPLPSQPPHRTQSPAAASHQSLTGMSAPTDSSGFLLPAGPPGDPTGSRQLQSQSTAFRPSTAWTSSLGGSPPRSVHRFGSRENSAMMEEARRVAQQAVEVLYGSEQEVSAADRAAASAALQQLEALLGPREISLTALAQATRNLRSDLGRELHTSDKQASFARAQLKALERQHDRLRQQLQPRPDPISLPSPGVSGLSDTGTPSVSPKMLLFDGVGFTSSISGSISAPQSPMAARIGGLRAESPLPWPPPATSVLNAGGNDGGGSDVDYESGGSRASGNGALATPAFANGLDATGSSLTSSDKWSLAGAMERTMQMRALSRAEAAMQAVAAAHAVQERPPSSGGGEGGMTVDVEELRRLKHTQGTSEAMAEPPSYFGVNMRHTPSPLPPGGEPVGLMLGGGGGGSASGSFSGGSGLDPKAVLQWSNRGISTSKMPLLREILGQSPHLVRLCLAGNKLSNEDVMELTSILSDPTAPRVHEINLDQNTNLSWRCALPLALALGMSPDMAASAAAADWAAVAAAMPASTTPATIVAPPSVPSARDKVRRLDLHSLSLCGVKLGDKGVSQLAEGLRANNSLRELDLRRCGISDAGGALLMDVLESNGMLQRLDVSWNALRAESARVLEVALAGNAGLREISLAHNGFGDLDGARIVKGLLSHGKWLRVDLSHNTLGPGSCMMVGELQRRLGDVAASLVQQDAYTNGWVRGPQRGGGGGGLPPLTPPGKHMVPDPSRRFGTLQGDDSSPPHSPTSIRIAAGQLGSQLTEGQPSLALDGNPLGSTGLRIILDSMEAMSQMLLASAGMELPDPTVLEPPPDYVPPLPLSITVHNCNVAPPSERSSNTDSGDEANPFLPSIAVLCRPASGANVKAAAGGKDTGVKKAAARPAGKGAGPKDRVTFGHSALTLHSPHLDLQSPAGVYRLDLSHPATAVLVAYLLRMRERLNAAVESGAVAGVALQIVGISINGKPMKVDQLAALEVWCEGTLQLTVKAPALLAVEPPLPLTPMVAQWLAVLLGESTASPLWKLSVVQAAGSVCFFTPWQCLALLAGFDRDTQSTECVTAAQMLYARSAQPLAFWDHVLPRLTSMQQVSLRERIGDLVALDMNRPMGRYTLNLSRQVDRFVAQRLQLASALECSWVESKYFINWRNASFNGQTLDRPGLTHIRDYVLPGAGVLRLDYVSYRKPGIGMPPAPPEELDELLARLRECTMDHITTLLQVRAQAQPPRPLSPDRREGVRSPVGRRRVPPGPPPPPKPRLSAFQLTHLPLLEAARTLADPGPPPPPVPDINGNMPPPPPPPVSWVGACAFNPEPIFRRTGVTPPEWSLAGYTIPPPTEGMGTGMGISMAASDLLSHAVSMGGKSVKSLGGRSTGAASRKSVKKGGKEDKLEEERAGGGFTQAEYHAAMLLMVHQAKDLPLVASKMTAAHLAGAVAALLRYDGGQRAVVALLTALPSLTASKFLYEQADPSPCLQSQELRKQLLAAMPPERVKLVEVAARGASEAAVRRARRVRTALNMWASQRCVTSDQVEAVLAALHTEGDRVAAMVVLWPVVADGRWKKTYLKLALSEQRQLMIRLGYFHVYTCLGEPHGVWFFLELGEPEQRDIARELVRMAVKETMRAKQEARSRGGFCSATLLDLHGNGNPVSIPEDENLWAMSDSNFKTMEFLYSPTYEQSLERVAASTVYIQRFWTVLKARRAERQALVVEASQASQGSRAQTEPGALPSQHGGVDQGLTPDQPANN